MFNEQKRTFEDERKGFTEAAAKLGYEVRTDTVAIVFDIK